ncbi:kinase-like domain-containing protein [Rhexocercosporidium sp. MPI-PUGE-AT-0058]|nr:kinase-like domain-containing protein [Rhexocercosporidium sp. MPI-PUGE-AT-0058]
MTSHEVDILRDCDVAQFYKYTSGRWLWNEQYHLSRRYVEFDLPGLLHVSAQAIGASSCVKVEKLPEGNFSKVFLITMDDDRELIAKLPNPNAGQPHFMTASEAATMDYVRNVLGIPAPQVYGWSSSTDNPVKAEYILMERSGGVELGKIWHDMPWDQRLEVVRTLAGYEKAFASANFPMYGSLYYAKDLPNPDLNQFLDSINSTDKEEAFVVGPTTNRSFFDQGRDSVEVNRGPWPSLNEFVHSRAARELACIDKLLSYPGQQGFFGGPNQYRPTRALKVGVLRDYLKVATQILPNDISLSKPTLWHSDLHVENIFVDPSKPTRILNIIDWQAVNVSPLFLQARHPSLIDFEGPIPEGFAPITLPDDFDAMSEEGQHQSKNLRAAQSLYKLYEILMLQRCPEIAHALRFRDTLPGQITGLASSIFSDGEPILQGMLIRLQDEWTTCINPAIPCPLSFTPDNRTQQQHLERSWSRGVELMHEVLTEIGAYQGWDGWVNHTNYPIYKERLAQGRENFLNRYAKTEEERSQWIQAWPFKDTTHPPSYL